VSALDGAAPRDDLARAAPDRRAVTEGDRGEVPARPAPGAGAAGIRPRPAFRRDRVGRFAVRLVALVALVAIWWFITWLQIWRPVYVPTPAVVWHQLIRTSTVHDGIRGYSGYLLWEHLWISVRRIALGSAVGAVLGIGAGLAIGTVAAVRLVLEPVVTFLRQLPPLAFFSLLIIWFGIDETPKIWLLVIAAFPPVAVATAAAVTGVHRDFLNGARSLGAHRVALIRHVVLPAALPEILTGIRLGTGVAYTSVVAAELVNGVPGIGGMIRDAQRYNQTDVVVLGILVLGITGLLIDSGLRWAERRFAPWRGLA
jgi:taurine transport system permease protein